MKIGQYCQWQRCRHAELKQFRQAFTSRGFVSDSWAFLFTYAVYKSLLYVLKNNYDSNYDIDWCCTHTSSLFDCVTWEHTLQYFVCCRTVLIVFLFIARAFISGGFQASYVYTPEVWYCHLHLSVLPVSYYLSASSRCIASQVIRNPISGTRFSDILNCQRKL